LFGIFIYVGYISPALKNKKHIKSDFTNSVPFFGQISVLKGTIEQLKTEIQTRIKLETLLRKSVDEAITANQAKSNFLANMSHELRTPLNSIIGFSQLLMDQEISASKEHKEMLSMIHESGNHLLQLINNILDLSRIESGKNECHWAPLKIQELLSSIVNILSFKIKEMNLQIIIDKSGCSEIVYADESKLKEIILIILENAIKFSYQNGRIEILLTNHDSVLQIQIRDYGIGIKAEDLKYLFNPFTQIDNLLTKKFQGTGLGLYYCKKLLELHKGTIILSSEFGKGTNIISKIPQPLSN
jgi:hypothetical protein